MWALAPKTPEGTFLLIITGEGIQIKMIILQPRKLIQRNRVIGEVIPQ